MLASSALPFFIAQLVPVVLLILTEFAQTSSGLSTESRTESFKTLSGKPVFQYGLGGAARSTQPSTLPALYFDEVAKRGGVDIDDTFETAVAPFYFYYNPHRYPDFMAGVKQVCSSHNREDIFVASGGTDRSTSSLDQRLSDCLEYCGGKYLDMFLLEYVLPEELIECEHGLEPDGALFGSRMKEGPALASAIAHAQQWVESGKVRYVGISTHSHEVGAALSFSTKVDALMLRYGMSHKNAAELISFPAAKVNQKPVIAFTSTRWNSLQNGIDDEQWSASALEISGGKAPSSAECISFVFGPIRNPSPVQVVLHSARDENELMECLSGLRRGLSEDEDSKWRSYGAIIENENKDCFDEYPQERFLGISEHGGNK